MALTENMIATAIGIMVLFFNIYATNVFTNNNDNEDYSFIGYYHSYSRSPRMDVKKYREDMKKQADERRLKQIEKERKDYNRFIARMVMGIMFIIISLFINNRFVRDGFALGGILTLLYSNVLNWSKFDDKKKLGIITAGLGSVIYMGVRVYNNQPWLPNINYVKLM